MKTALVVAVTLAVTLFPLVAPAQAPASRVVFENESIRVTVLTFAPGGATGRHVGLEPEIGITVEGELVPGEPGRAAGPDPRVRVLGAGPHPARRPERGLGAGQGMGRLPQALRMSSRRRGTMRNTRMLQVLAIGRPGRRSPRRPGRGWAPSRRR